MCHGRAHTCHTIDCVPAYHICYLLLYAHALLEAPGASSSAGPAAPAAEEEEEQKDLRAQGQFRAAYGPHHVPLPRQDFTGPPMTFEPVAGTTRAPLTKRQKRQLREHKRDYAWNPIFADPALGEEARVCRRLVAAAHRAPHRMLHVRLPRACA